MTSWEFEVENPVRLQLRTPDGSVMVTAAQTATATVTLDGSGATGTRVEFGDGTLSVLAPDHASLTAIVALPEGSSCAMQTASADVRCHGQLGALDIHTASGDVSAEQASGATEIVTASGDVYLGDGTDVSLKTASGDIAVGHASGAVTVQTASGDVVIGDASGRRVEVTAASGDISVAVPPGSGVYLDLWSLSGTVRSDLEPAGDSSSADMTVHCRSISGDVHVSRAPQPAPR
jgi:DUF4097 and DUF4098 domain-containing protein YvlB